MSDIAAVCAALRGYYLLGNEVFEAEGATFARNRACPRRYDANFVTAVRCETQAEVARLLARAEREYAGFGHRQFHLDPLTPLAMTARLALDDFPFSEQLVMRLEGEPRCRVRAVDIRPIEDDAGWVDFAALQEADWEEACRKQGKVVSPGVTIEFLASKRCKSPAAQYWLAYDEGEPAAYFSSWAAPNGIGVLEDLFTRPDRRHRGIATALLVHCAADTRRRGAGPVVLSALTDDTPKHMYTAMGFEPLYVQRMYTRSRA